MYMRERERDAVRIPKLYMWVKIRLIGQRLQGVLILLSVFVYTCHVTVCMCVRVCVRKRKRERIVWGVSPFLVTPCSYSCSY